MYYSHQESKAKINYVYSLVAQKLTNCSNSSFISALERWCNSEAVSDQTWPTLPVLINLPNFEILCNFNRWNHPNIFWFWPMTPDIGNTNDFIVSCSAGSCELEFFWNIQYTLMYTGNLGVFFLKNGTQFLSVYGFDCIVLLNDVVMSHTLTMEGKYCAYLMRQIFYIVI